MPRLRKYSEVGYTEQEHTHTSLMDGINAYFDLCEQNGVYPDEAGMRIYLGISKETVERYLYNEGGKYPGYDAPIKNARDRRESMLTRDLYNAQKDAVGKIFLAKQISNGGLIDRPADNNGGKVEFVLTIGQSDGKTAAEFCK